MTVLGRAVLNQKWELQKIRTLLLCPGLGSAAGCVLWGHRFVTWGRHALLAAALCADTTNFTKLS